MIKDGLFGFNGALIAIALVAYTSPNFTTGNIPNIHLCLYIVLCAVFTTVILPAFGALLGSPNQRILKSDDREDGLAMPRSP